MYPNEKRMKKQDIEKNIHWDHYGIGYIDLPLPLFDKVIPFELFVEKEANPKISDKMFATVQDVLNLKPDSIEEIKELLWEECNFSFTVANYGCRPKDGETVKAAHFREFGINDLHDAFEKSSVKGIQIHCDSDKLEGRYAEIKMETATDNLISIVVKNGKVIDYDEDGTYLGGFESDEQNAHNNRERVLNQ